MKLRIMSPQLGLNPNSVLGGEIYDHEILKGLSKQGVEVEILLPKNRPYDTTIKNWHITKLPLTHIPAWLFNLLEIPYFVGLGAWFFRLFHPKVKLVATYHQARSGFPYDLINHLFVRAWDAVITDNKSAKTRLIEKFGVDPQKITVIHGGAPTNLRPGLNQTRPGLETNKIILLFMGLLIPRKNPLLLIDVMKVLVKTHPNLRLIICGEGPLESVIKQRIQTKKLQNHIFLHAPVFSKAKQDLYNQADVFVHPALHEGFPLVVLEAMACGLPIVITDKPWGREAINGNGYVAKCNDVQDWVSKLSLLIKNKKIRQKFGQKSYTLATKTFTWENAAQKHYECLLSL